MRYVGLGTYGAGLISGIDCMSAIVYATPLVIVYATPLVIVLRSKGFVTIDSYA